MFCADLPRLPRALLAAGFVFAAVPLGATASLAQTSPTSDQVSQSAVCQARAGARDIEQDAFGTFPSECMTEVVPPTASTQERFDECRAQARAREHEGELYAQFLHMCMAAPSSGTAAVNADRAAAHSGGW